MVSSAYSSPYFLCLCGNDRQGLLANACAPRAHRIEFYDQIEALLARALLEPPQGLILELATAVRFGAERMSKFLNLGVNWPVMRCAIGQEGDARVMCFEPAHGVSLLEALDGIMQRDPSWQHPRFVRRHLRLNIPGRVRLRTQSQEQWQRGNLQGLSCGGCFILMSHELPAIGATVDLELVDLQPTAQRLVGEVTWQRRWEDGLALPGVGIEFDPEWITDEFRQFITKSPQLADIIADEY